MQLQRSIAAKWIKAVGASAALAECLLALVMVEGDVKEDEEPIDENRDQNKVWKQ